MLSVSGKKGKTMERRLLKDFHIGIVEGLVQEMSIHGDEPKSVFGHIAKVIGRRTTFRAKKKDWNALVRRNTLAHDPIGSAQELEYAKTRRQSLRKYIISNIRPPLKLDDKKLLEYNPRLADVPKRARQAYAKFMSKKIESEYNSEGSWKEKPRKSSVSFLGFENEPTQSCDPEASPNLKRESLKCESDDGFTAWDPNAKSLSPLEENNGTPSNTSFLTPAIATIEYESTTQTKEATNLQNLSSEKCYETEKFEPPLNDSSPSRLNNLNKTEEETNTVPMEGETGTQSNLSDKNNDPFSTGSKLTGKTRNEWI